MIKLLLERFEALSGREKFITVTALAVVLWGVGNSLIIQPNLETQKQIQQQVSNLEIQIEANRQAATQIERRGKIDPDQKNRDRLQSIGDKLADLQNQINKGSKQFVPPERMAMTLHTILKQHQLNLLKLETLPVTSLTDSENQSSIYRHGLTITFSGNYFAVLNYLKSLEAQPWHFYWESLLYKVTEYPVAEVTITIHTLSFEEDWLSV